MAISTFTELKDAIASWMDRDDARLTGNAENLIALCESRLNSTLPLRTMQVDTTLTGTISSRQLTLPTDMAEPIALYLTTYTDDRWLRPFLAGSGPELAYSGGNAEPSAWTVNGLYIDLDAPCDQAHTFKFRYRQTFALSSGSPTNYLLTNYPNVYLFGSMVEAYSLLKSAEKAMLWEQRFQQALDDARAREGRSTSMATLVLDPMLSGGGGFDINTGGW